MNASSRPKKKHDTATRAQAAPAQHASEWARPISEDHPCGPNLEYDNEYAVLLAKLRPQAEVQYGSFVGQPDPLDWSDIERDCRRLLLRSKDILLLVCLCRCRARLGGALGLAQALEGMLETLQTYPDAVHPQLEIEGQWDPVVRANAMANLADPEGLMADVRDIVVVSHTALRLSIKDIERSFSVPRPSDAMAPDLMQQQLADLQARGAPELSALTRAAAALEGLEIWSQQNLQDAAPKLEPLRHLLARIPVQTLSPASDGTSDLGRPPLSEPLHATENKTPSRHEPQGSPKPPAPARHLTPSAAEVLIQPCEFGTGMSAEQGREHAKKLLRTVCAWLQKQEPSSPVTVVLQQAEQMIGMPYSDLSQIIPLEIYLKWESNFRSSKF